MRTVRRVSVLVAGSKMRTVWWSDCEKVSAVTTVFFSTLRRASMSSGYRSASAWNTASATTSLPTLPTFCLWSPRCSA